MLMERGRKWFEYVVSCKMFPHERVKKQKKKKENQSWINLLK